MNQMSHLANNPLAPLTHILTTTDIEWAPVTVQSPNVTL